MFKNHPKGLLGAALSNMGERFGFYIMMAILILFLEFKFDFVGTPYGGLIYSIFYALIYVLALAGGFIADRTKKYKGTITMGLILMMIGYLIIAWPTPTPAPQKTLTLVITCFGLFAIAFGNGMFKGNLQAIVGQLYDNNPQYEERRTIGYQIFYMFINVGAMFAPVLAVGLRNWVVSSQGYAFNSDLPALCNEFISNSAAMTQEALARFSALAVEVGNKLPGLNEFAHDYLSVFVRGYHYSFAIAIFAMMISFVIFMANKKKFPNPSKKVKSADTRDMDIAEIRQRIYALFAVFFVVIFFWFSFHQNGVTLTKFANDYTQLDGMVLDLGFTQLKGAELFQSFNPLFVVFLTPIIIGFFGWLRAKGKEPSIPRKIGIGMGIAACAFIVMAIFSYGLPSTAQRMAEGGLDSALRVTPWLLIGTYFILTVAELFISPLGLAFVSKVAPPNMQGVMQGAWLSATAIGNQLLFIGTIFYNSLPIWATWTLFVAACLISMGTMLGMVKWLERVTK
ncbi:MAG: peptide MFS transporter [Prevotellaceae bacterium]|jgi:POT family proton-dependent oligopeptide transporter|nr:peptide MFS transporter [Prevotellaceae bacterium]